jgi:glucokinase
MIQHNHTVVLAGDIGGTKTNLGLFTKAKVTEKTKGKNRPVLQAVETYSSPDAGDLSEIIKRFMDTHPAGIDSACFGIAGPVVNGRCKTTNLPWIVTERRIRQDFRWRHVRLLNDVAATALAVPLLTGRELFALNKARLRKDKNIALLALGTGLGQALLVHHDGRYRPIASEGGHADFSPKNDEEIRLWQYLHRRYGHVSIERVLSGQGLIHIYEWLKDLKNYREPSWLSAKMDRTDPAKVISETALAKKDPLCRKSLEIFVSICGTVAGNLALTGLTLGGVFLGGGIAPKILPQVKADGFLQAFTNKGRFKNLLEKIAVRVILNDKAALLGAAAHATETAAK